MPLSKIEIAYLKERAQELGAKLFNSGALTGVQVGSYKKELAKIEKLLKKEGHNEPIRKTK